VVFIATLAALIASRAMTTAIFSTIKQATALGCFPRLKIIHTSRKFMGQIYIPVMNWFLLVSCLAFVTVFGSINEIGNAYGTILSACSHCNLFYLSLALFSGFGPNVLSILMPFFFLLYSFLCLYKPLLIFYIMY
jgi:K+ transporter